MTSAMTPGPAPDASAGEAARFFPGQLVGPEDLSQDQVYFRERLRRHNRLLHGWGVACGAGVSPGPEPGTVVVGAGLVLGPWGDEIWIGADVVVDLRAADADGTLTVSGALAARSPQPAAAPRQPGQVLHLAVRYTRYPTNQVRVPGTVCGCDDGGSEYTRLADGYVLAALDALPDGYDPMVPPDVAQVFGETAGALPCPPAPRDPWVILADVTMATAQEVGSIDLYTRRRHAAAWGAYYYLNPPRLLGLTAPESVPNSTPFQVTATLDGPSPDDQALGLSTNPPIIFIPSPPPTIVRGQTSVIFELAAQSTASTPVPTTLAVSYRGSTQTATVTVQPGPVG